MTYGSFHVALPVLSYTAQSYASTCARAAPAMAGMRSSVRLLAIDVTLTVD
jgi:hypothetical protein